MKLVRKQVRAGNLEFPNQNSRHPNADESDVRLANAHEVSVLVDPESTEGGSLHFSNHDKTPTQRKRGRRLKANSELRDLPDDDSNNVSTLPNSTDPTQGVYGDDSDTILRNAQGDSELGITANDGDDDEDFMDDPFLDDDEGGDDQDDALDIESTDEDEDDAPEWDEDDLDIDLEGELDDDEDEDINIHAEAEEPEDTTALPIAEIRQVNDTVENLAFVMNAGTLLAIKDTTVVASMTKARAAKNKVEDLYASAAFHGLLKQEVRKHELIAALVANGFRQERVDLRASRVVGRQLRLETNRIQANLQRNNAKIQAALDQSVGIAAVGISRNFFKKVDNPLRAALERELVAAGVRNPGRMLQRVFASYGHEYVQRVLDTAHKIAAMSDEVRNDYSEALDISNEIPEEACNDMTADSHDVGDAGDPDFDFVPDSDNLQVTAALLRKPSRVTASTKSSVNASARAQAILRGELPLFQI